MMSFHQLEQHYQLLQVVQNYEVLIRRYDRLLSSYRIDGMPHDSNKTNDRFDKLLIKREQALAKLPRLKALLKAQIPEVDQTIKAIRSSRAKNCVRRDLIFEMRYKQGSTWEEIGDLLNDNPSKIRGTVIDALNKAENNHE